MRHRRRSWPPSRAGSRCCWPATCCPYFGDLTLLLRGAAARLAPGGRFIFSTEALGERGGGLPGWQLGKQGRYRHGAGHIAARGGGGRPGRGTVAARRWCATRAMPRFRGCSRCCGARADEPPGADGARTPAGRRPSTAPSPPSPTPRARRSMRLPAWCIWPPATGRRRGRRWRRRSALGEAGPVTLLNLALAEDRLGLDGRARMRAVAALWPQWDEPRLRLAESFRRAGDDVGGAGGIRAHARAQPGPGRGAAGAGGAASRRARRRRRPLPLLLRLCALAPDHAEAWDALGHRAAADRRSGGGRGGVRDGAAPAPGAGLASPCAAATPPMRQAAASGNWRGWKWPACATRWTSCR